MHQGGLESRNCPQVWAREWIMCECPVMDWQPGERHQQTPVTQLCTKWGKNNGWMWFSVSNYSSWLWKPGTKQQNIIYRVHRCIIKHLVTKIIANLLNSKHHIKEFFVVFTEHDTFVVKFENSLQVSLVCWYHEVTATDGTDTLSCS